MAIDHFDNDDRFLDAVKRMDDAKAALHEAQFEHDAAENALVELLVQQGRYRFLKVNHAALRRAAKPSRSKPRKTAS